MTTRCPPDLLLDPDPLDPNTRLLTSVTSLNNNKDLKKDSVSQMVLWVGEGLRYHMLGHWLSFIYDVDNPTRDLYAQYKTGSISCMYSC